MASKVPLGTEVLDSTTNGSLSRLEGLIDKAGVLCQRCNYHTHIPGMSRLLKSCQAEKQFLIRLRKKKQLEVSHLNCTNISHLEAVLVAVETLPHVVQVLQPFTCTHSNQSVTVDVVCNHGYTWVKVIARKPQSLHRTWIGEGQYGEKPITDQAALYLSCAARYPVSFSAPQVLFWFTSGVTAPLAETLQQDGVCVYGQLYDVITQQKRKKYRLGESNTALESKLDCEDYIPSASELLNSMSLADDDDDDDDDDDEGVNCSRFYLVPAQDSPFPDDPDITNSIYPSSLSSLFCSIPSISRVNLDITSLICIVSNVCHGRCHLVFEESVLSQQAAWERERPVLPKIHSFIKGKELVACQTAIADFRSILRTVGGENEKQRAEEFLREVTVVPDQVSEWAEQLQLTHQVKHRAKTIFGTGHYLKAVTMTANSGFVRAAMKQSMNFAVFLHESRALTEQKEPTAKPL